VGDADALDIPGITPGKSSRSGAERDVANVPMCRDTRSTRRTSTARPSSNMLSNDGAMLKLQLKHAVSNMSKRCDTSDDKIVAFAEESKRRFDEIVSLVSPLLSVIVSMKGVGVGRSQRASPLEGCKRQDLIDGRVAVLDVLISHEVGQQMIETVLIGFLNREFQDKQYTAFGCAGARNIRAIMFSKLPGDDRTLFETEEGKQHSSFRMCFMLSIFHMLQVDSLGLYSASDTAHDHEVDAPLTKKGTRTVGIPQPPWLKPRYIHKGHCEIAQLSKETASSGGEKRKKQKDELITRDEIAVAGALRLYSIITDLLAYLGAQQDWRFLKAQDTCFVPGKRMVPQYFNPT